MQHSLGDLTGALVQGAAAQTWGGAKAASRRLSVRWAVLVGLVAVDALCIAGAFFLAYLLRFKTSTGAFYTPPDSPLLFYSTLVFWFVPLVLGTFAIYRLYSFDFLFEGSDEYVRVLSATTLSVIVVILVSFLFDDRLVISRAWIILAWATIFLAVASGRFATRRIVYRLRRVGFLTKRVLVLGARSDTTDLVNYLGGAATSGLQIVGTYDPQAVLPDAVDGDPDTGPWLRQLIASTGADAIIINAAVVPQPILARIVRDLAELPTELHLIPGMYEILTTGVRVIEVRGLPLVRMNKVRITGYDRLMKGALDYAVATLALLVLSPVLLAIALVVRYTSPGPILHRRRVIGQCGRRFDALKFRTMYTNGAEILAARPDLAAQLAHDGKLIDDPRITPIGRWLRRWSLDEVPQLFNVLRGQMSLVGPRMISEAELPRFGHWRENLSTVKPGLTGLWQVSGRSTLGYDDRVRLDMHYIRSYSIWSDLAILVSTLPAVIRGEGAY
jgi:exopolysaccharide biosynthesis polyprenyl glycosylphosphotransferase